MWGDLQSSDHYYHARSARQASVIKFIRREPRATRRGHPRHRYSGSAGAYRTVRSVGHGNWHPASAAAAFAAIIVRLLGDWNRPKPAPLSAMRHTTSSVAGCAGRNASMASPPANMLHCGGLWNVLFVRLKAVLQCSAISGCATISEQLSRHTESCQHEQDRHQCRKPAHRRKRWQNAVMGVTKADSNGRDADVFVGNFTKDATYQGGSLPGVRMNTKNGLSEL
jgi:hypothetical protein